MPRMSYALQIPAISRPCSAVSPSPLSSPSLAGHSRPTAAVKDAGAVYHQAVKAPVPRRSRRVRAAGSDDTQAKTAAPRGTARAGKLLLVLLRVFFVDALLDALL